MWVSIEQEIKPGEETFIDSMNDSYGVTFEDNQETGYFYAVKKEEGIEIQDALHIYNANDKNLIKSELTLKIIWTDDNTMAALVINDLCHAIFDFKKKYGYNRNAFPEPRKWNQGNRKLTEEIENEFIKK